MLRKKNVVCVYILTKNWVSLSFMFGCPLSACLRERTTDDLFFLLLLLNSLIVSQFIQYNGQLCLKFIQIMLPNPLDLNGLNLLIYMAALIYYFFFNSTLQILSMSSQVRMTASLSLSWSLHSLIRTILSCALLAHHPQSLNSTGYVN